MRALVRQKNAIDVETKAKVNRMRTHDNLRMHKEKSVISLEPLLKGEIIQRPQRLLQGENLSAGELIKDFR